MKRIGLFIITLMILLPPIQVHGDIIVYEEAYHHIEGAFEEAEEHSDMHHDNDTDEDKHTKHHHHCVDIAVYNVYLHNRTIINLDTIDTKTKQQLGVYKIANYTSYLEGVFQPPKVSFHI